MPRRDFATVLVVFLVACSAPQVASDGPNSPAPSASAWSGSPSLGPVERAAFPNCRLPYLKVSPGGLHSTGGFVEGSQGLWTADARGGITTSGQYLYVSEATPALIGDGVRIEDVGGYDSAVGRWLPVRHTQIRNDGLAYAYAEPYKANPTDSFANSTRIHVVSVVDGGDRVIYSGAPRAVISFEPEGIYVAVIKYDSDNTVSGLWRLDPTTGAGVEMSTAQVGWIEVMDHGIAWTDGGGISGLARLDLSSGNQQTWANVGGLGWIWFVGLDSRGNALAALFLFGPRTADGGLVAFRAPAVKVPIANVDFHQHSITDNHGTWLAGPDGIYLVDANDKVTKLSDETGGTIAGACD